MKSVRVHKLLLPILAVAALLGSVWIAQAAGLWQTSGRGELLLDESGQADPAGIKGWMTLETVAETYAIPLGVLLSELGLPADVDADLALREVAEQYGVEVFTIREVVARYQAER